MERGIPIKSLLLSREQKLMNGNSKTRPYQSGAYAPLFEVPSFNIQGLPVEIRLLIFQEYILAASEETPNSKTPPLIKALRPSPIIYNEALEAFYSFTFAIVSLRNREQVLSMPRRPFKRASLLRVWYGLGIPGASPIGKNTLIAYCPDTLVALCSNVRELHITTDMVLPLGTCNWDKRLLGIIRKFIVFLPLLKRLVVDVPLRSKTIIVDGPNITFQLLYPVKPINEAIGIQHYWADDWTGSDSSRKTFSTWVAQGGQTIRWTDKDYCESVPWANTTLLSYTIVTLLHRRVFSSERNLHFLGLSPRMIIHFCRKTHCRCEGLKAKKPQVFDPARWLTLSPFSPKTLNEESDLSIYWRTVLQQEE